MLISNEDYMQEALVEAAHARDAGNWAIGCVITLNGEIVVRGQNRVHSDRNRMMHAEMDALLQLQRDHFDYGDKELILYTTFEPCPMCFGAILVSGIRTIIAGSNFDDSGASAYLDHLPNFFKQDRFSTKYTTGVLAQDCAKMWLSADPVRRMIDNGYELPKRIEDISNDDIKVYTTSAITQDS